MQMKACDGCMELKPILEFPKRWNRCKTCVNAVTKLRVGKGAYGYEHDQENKARYRRKLKQDIVDAYGKECACCGESNFEFLQLDHIHGDGIKHRRELGSANVYKAVRDEGFPEDKYRLLCANCNHSHGMYGYCPHEKEEIKAS